MTPVLLTLALISGADDKAAAPALDGTWLIVYAEEGSKRNSSWEQRVATAKGDTLSYSKDGDDRSLKLTFGEKQTVKATAPAVGGKGEATMTGVYIAGQDYLCLSMDPGDAKPAAGKEGKASSSSFILILRRQR